MASCWIFHAMVSVKAQWWKKTVLIHQRAQRNGGKVECQIEKMLRNTIPYRFQSNGLSLKQGEEIVHSFKVKQIKCTEAK